MECFKFECTGVSLSVINRRIFWSVFVSMKISPSSIPLQRIIQSLPKSLRRIKIAQAIAFITGSPYHRIAFQRGELIGNVRDNEVANSLVKGRFADYGYFELARCLLGAGDVHVDVGANYGFHTFGLLQYPADTSMQYILVDANPGLRSMSSGKR